VEKGGTEGQIFPGFGCGFPTFSHHFPALPTISHLFHIDFLTTDGHRWTRIVNWRKHWRRPYSAQKLWRAGRIYAGKKCGLLRESPRSFTKVRTDQGRGYAMLRIVTGGTLFNTDGPRNEHGWEENGVVEFWGLAVMGGLKKFAKCGAAVESLRVSTPYQSI